MFRKIRRLLCDDSGAAAIEYSVMAGLAGVAIASVLSQAGALASGIFRFLGWAIGSAPQ